jgi:hypothetical protein
MKSQIHENKKSNLLRLSKKMFLMAALFLGAAVSANAAIVPAKALTVKEVKANNKHPKHRKAKKVKAAAGTTTAQNTQK